MGERQKCLTVLGLKEGANEDEIRKAYKRLALQYHPDKNGSDDAKGKFQEIGYAYKYLTEGPSAFDGIPDNDLRAEILRRLFEEMFFPSYIFQSRQGFSFGGGFPFFYASDSDNDCYYNCGSSDDNDDDWLPRQQYSPGKHYQNTFPGPQKSSETEHPPSKKNQRKVEKRQRQKEREREQKAEKEEQRKYRPTNVYTDDIRGEDTKGQAGVSTPDQMSTNNGSQERVPTPTQNQQKPTKKQKKKLFSDQRKRDEEMKDIAAEILRKREVEKEKQREKERQDAERKNGEVEDNDSVLGWFDNGKKSRKARQREKRRQEMAGTQEPGVVNGNGVPLQQTGTSNNESDSDTKRQTQHACPASTPQNSSTRTVPQNEKFRPPKDAHQKTAHKGFVTTKPQGNVRSQFADHKLPASSSVNRYANLDLCHDPNDCDEPADEKTSEHKPGKFPQNQPAATYPSATRQTVENANPQTFKPETVNANKGINQDKQNKGVLGDFPGHSSRQYDNMTGSIGGRNTAGFSRKVDNPGMSWEDIRSRGRYPPNDANSNGVFYPMGNEGQQPPSRFNHPPSPTTMNSNPYKLYAMDPFDPNIMHPPGFQARPRQKNPLFKDEGHGGNSGPQWNPGPDPSMDHVREPPQAHFNGPRHPYQGKKDQPHPRFQSPEFSGRQPRFQGAQSNGPHPRFQRAEFSGPHPRFQGAQFNGPNPRFQGAQSSGPHPGFQRAEFRGPRPGFKNMKSDGPRSRFQSAQFSGPNIRFQSEQFNGPRPKFQHSHSNEKTSHGQAHNVQDMFGIQLDGSSGDGDVHLKQSIYQNDMSHGNNDKTLHSKTNQNASDEGIVPNVNKAPANFDNIDSISSDESPVPSRTDSPDLISSENNLMASSLNWADLAAEDTETTQHTAEYGIYDNIHKQNCNSDNTSPNSLDSLDDFTIPGLLPNNINSAAYTDKRRNNGGHKYYPEGLGVGSYTRDELGVPDAIFTNKIQQYYAK